MAVLVILSLILVRNLSVENPGKKQLLLETGVSFLQDFFMGILGEEGKQYVPYLMSTVIYIGIANIAGVFGFTPPTKDMNVTIALALIFPAMLWAHRSNFARWREGKEQTFRQFLFGRHEPQREEAGE